MEKISFVCLFHGWNHSHFDTSIYKFFSVCMPKLQPKHWSRVNINVFADSLVNIFCVLINSAVQTALLYQLYNCNSWTAVPTVITVVQPSRRRSRGWHTVMVREADRRGVVCGGRPILPRGCPNLIGLEGFSRLNLVCRRENGGWGENMVPSHPPTHKHTHTRTPLRTSSRPWYFF